MHFMQKETSNLSPLVEQVLEIIERDNLTQDDVGRLVEVSQGHLSKILRGEQQPGPKAKRLLASFIHTRSPGVDNPIEQDLGRQVERIAATSPEFASLIRAALQLMKTAHS